MSVVMSAGFMKFRDAFDGMFGWEITFPNCIAALRYSGTMVCAWTIGVLLSASAVWFKPVNAATCDCAVLHETLGGFGVAIQKGAVVGPG